MSGTKEESGLNESAFFHTVFQNDKITLAKALADIYSRLNCDELGDYNPEESVAGHSGTDFAESCQHTFKRLLGH